jgi:uncharacterized SAM-binding protein YcdF (DUF218 family)
MSVFLNKLLPLPFMPLGVAMTLIAWAAFARVRWPAVAAFVLLWFCSMPVSSELLLRRIEAAYPRIEVGECPPADAVVVLGGYLRQSNGSTPEYPEVSAGYERLLRGVDLLREGRVHYLVLYSAKIEWLAPGRISEGEFARRIALGMGLDLLSFGYELSEIDRIVRECYGRIFYFLTAGKNHGIHRFS